MTDRIWQLRFGNEGATSRYVSSDDYVISVSPIPGLVHLLGPVTHEGDETEPDGIGPRRDLIAVCEIGDWATLMVWFKKPEESGMALGVET